jgi:hypothetical protein
MARFAGPREALEAAESPDASLGTLNELSGSEYTFVRTAVARHPRTPATVLRALQPATIEGEPDAALAVAIAEHRSTPPVTLAALAELTADRLGNPREAGWAFRLGVALCRHPNTPPDAIRRLLQHERALTQFRKVVARESDRTDVAALLATDRSEVVRRAAARPRTPVKK